MSECKECSKDYNPRLERMCSSKPLNFKLCAECEDKKETYTCEICKEKFTLAEFYIFDIYLKYKNTKICKGCCVEIECELY